MVSTDLLAKKLTFIIGMTFVQWKLVNFMVLHITLKQLTIGAILHNIAQ